MRNVSLVILMGAMAGCGDRTQVTQPFAAQAGLTPTPRYEVVKFSSSLGGTQSRGLAINNRGWVAGFSNLPGNGSRHAVLWREHDSLIDLRTLGGPNSSVAWLGLNDRGVVVGISQTAAPDTLGESWSCSAFFPLATSTGRICLGFVWEDGVMTPLPTLGGDNGYATAVNTWGQVVGWAETRVHDPTCKAPQVLQFRAVLWEPKRGRKRELRPLPGDSTSAATAINEWGQAVGISGDCDVAVGRFSARNAVLWERGEPKKLPNLGGISWHTATAINNRGDIVGFSNPAGDTGGIFIPHAFLWTRRGGIVDLGLLEGDQTSQALAINAWGQVVGLSTGAAGNRAVLWQDGVILDLNTLVGPGFPDRLITAADINDLGQITGRLLEAGTGKTLMFVATPIRAEH